VSDAWDAEADRIKARTTRAGAALIEMQRALMDTARVRSLVTKLSTREDLLVTLEDLVKL
jgi:hypothetical protein